MNQMKKKKSNPELNNSSIEILNQMTDHSRISCRNNCSVGEKEKHLDFLASQKPLIRSKYASRIRLFLSWIIGDRAWGSRHCAQLVQKELPSMVFLIIMLLRTNTLMNQSFPSQKIGLVHSFFACLAYDFTGQSSEWRKESFLSSFSRSRATTAINIAVHSQQLRISISNAMQ